MTGTERLRLYYAVCAWRVRLAQRQGRSVNVDEASTAAWTVAYGDYQDPRIGILPRFEDLKGE